MTALKAFVLFSLVQACSDLKPASEPDGGVNGSTASSSSGGSSSGDAPTTSSSSSGGGSSSSSSGGGSSSSGGMGAGPFGALPSGYCCTKNEDCRERNCLQKDGIGVCADSCASTSSCLNGAVPLTCVGFTAFELGHCEPTNTPTTCLPANTFRYGGKQLGECCAVTRDLTAGKECAGNTCLAFGEPGMPYICTHACRSRVDCPGSFRCIPTGDTYGVCAPEDVTRYTCK